MEALKHLIELYRSGFAGLYETTMPLREAVGGPFTATQQQDAHEFWGSLLQMVPRLQQLFAFKHTERVATCSVCSFKHDVPDVRFNMCIPSLYVVC